MPVALELEKAIEWPCPNTQRLVTIGELLFGYDCFLRVKDLYQSFLYSCYRVHACVISSTRLVTSCLGTPVTNAEPGLYDPRRKLELCGDSTFVMPCGQSFVDVDPGCHESDIVCILKERKAIAEEEMELIPENIASRVRDTAFSFYSKVVRS